MDEYKKCKLESGSVELCETLKRALEDSWTKKGLSCLPTFNIAEGMEAETFYIVKSGDFAKRGIVLNFCPFCGGKMHVHDQVLI